MSKKQSVIDRFRDFYLTQTTEDKTVLYYAIAAVRGPDMCEKPIAQFIKDNIVMKVRGALFGKGFNFGNFEPRFTRAEVRDELGWHFCGHLEKAEKYLGIKLFKEDEKTKVASQ